MSSKENKSGRPKKGTNPFNDIFRKIIDSATQQEAADKIGVSRQNVGRWLLGDTTPDIETLCKIATAYNVSTDYLLGRTGVKTPDPELKKFLSYMRLSEKSFENLCFIAQGGWSANILLESEWLGALVRVLTNIDEWSSKLNYYNQVIVPAINESISSDDESKDQEENLVCIRDVLYSEFRNIVNSQIDSDDNIKYLDYEYMDKIDLYEFKLSKVLKSMVDEIRAEHRADKMIFELSNKSVFDRLNKRKNDIEKLVQEYETEMKTYEKSAKEVVKTVEKYILQLNAINTILENYDEFFKPKKGADPNG